MRTDYGTSDTYREDLDREVAAARTVELTARHEWRVRHIVGSP
ncbi:hypothetical protein AB0K00_09755 [Dactylosporangium sp. NPDC049525]